MTRQKAIRILRQFPTMGFGDSRFGEGHINMTEIVELLDEAENLHTSVSKDRVIEYLTDLECTVLDAEGDRYTQSIEEVKSLIKEYGGSL